jgi:hypothetical protein
MTLYCQRRRGDWDEVFARVAPDVAKLAALFQLFPRID